MAVDASLTTADELLRMPKGRWRYELLRGELRVMEPTGIEHGRVASTVGALLFAHVRRTGSGVTLGAETGFVLESDPDTVRAPDAAFISQERYDRVGPTAKYWRGAPDFAVEVLSPSDRPGEVREKLREWLAAGTIAVVVLDPDRRTATVHRSGREARVHGLRDTLDLSDAVPGFRPTVAELFG
ncbi:MAG TPA: Uma2 family endonuclease [Solirubrobacteraceae bacterium]|jgi:Uma2 family endonuclease|nr:Uma2 family endonuclease [Solirubrobacteraceae bacterium]